MQTKRNLLHASRAIHSLTQPVAEPSAPFQDIAHRSHHQPGSTFNILMKQFP